MASVRATADRGAILETLPEPLAQSAGTIIPSPGPAPTVTPIAGPIVQSGPYTVAAGQTVFGSGLAYLFDSVLPGFVTPFVNNGTIWSSAVSADPNAFSYMSIGRYDRLRDVTNNGLIVLETGANQLGLTAAFSNTNLVNTGSLYVISHGSNNAWGVEFSNGIDNSGLIAVRSDNASAIGLIMPNGGEVRNRAGASLLVEGESATAIVFGDAPISQTTPSRILNDGRIEAHSLGQNASVAILASHLYGRVDVVNSGIIKADFAYVSDFGTTVAAAFVDSLTNQAGGRIEGRILMDRGDDLITNLGAIVGDVFMEEGADLFDGRGGSVEGVVDLGWGADQYLGGSGDDRVAGDDGDDRLEGGAGADLLMGGGNNDVLIGDAGSDGLFGEYGNDRIVTLGGDFVEGGAGDDRIEAGDFAFEFIGGGAGFDTLVLNGGARALDLSLVLADQALSDIEALILTGGQTLSIAAGDIGHLTGGDASLFVTTTAFDQLALVGAWAAGGEQTVAGVAYLTWSLAGATVFVSGAGGVTTNAVSSGGGLDPLTDKLAPLPGAGSGLGLTSNLLQLDAYEMHQSLTVNAEQHWFSQGSAVLTSFSNVTLTNFGSLSSYRDAASTDGLPAFVVGGGSNNIERITNHGLISLINDSTWLGGGTSFAIATNAFGQVTNHGTIEAENAAGRLTAVSAGGLANHGRVAAIGAAGPVIAADLGSILFENHGEIVAHSGGVEPFFGIPMTTYQGRPLSVAVVAYAGTHANFGTITATSAVSTGAVGIWFEVSAGRTEVFSNAGVITADVAVQVRSDFGGDGAINLTNTNRLDGRVVLGGGADVVVNSGVITGRVELGGGADTFDGRQGVQGVSVSGGGGNDTLQGGAGLDTAYFAGARSAYVIATVNGVTSVTGPDGTDTLAGIEQLAFDDGLFSIAGAPLAVYLNGTAAGETLVGGAGQDIINAAGGADTVFGGDGADILNGEDGDDVLVGNAQIFAQEQDTLNGGAGDDILYAEWTDTLTGGSGRDSLIAVNGFDFILDMAATSIEYAILDFGDDRIDASAQSVRVDVFASGGDDSVIGSAYSDLIFAGVGDDTVQGGAGDDAIVGGEGIDDLSGGAGDDRVYFDAQDRFVSGGEGYDAGYITPGTGTGVLVNLGAASLEFVQDLAGRDDILLGLSSVVGLSVYAGDGADRVDGSNAADVLWGEAGADTITGNGGADVLVGGLGADSLNGGAGIDILYGGAFDAVTDSFRFTHFGVANADVVYEFEAGIDRLDLSAFGSTLASLSVVTSGGSSTVYLNGELICTVVGVTNLTGADFMMGPVAAEPGGGDALKADVGLVLPDPPAWQDPVVWVDAPPYDSLFCFA